MNDLGQSGFSTYPVGTSREGVPCNQTRILYYRKRNGALA